MASKDHFKIDDNFVAGLGKQWGNLSDALGRLKDYAAFNGGSSGSSGDGLTATHFGGTSNAASAAQVFLTTMQGLDASVGKAKDYATAVGQAFTASAQSTKETDADNAFGVTKSGQGA
jgi:hypothetical protein